MTTAARTRSTRSISFTRWAQKFDADPKFRHIDPGRVKRFASLDERDCFPASMLCIQSRTSAHEVDQNIRVENGHCVRSLHRSRRDDRRRWLTFSRTAAANSSLTGSASNDLNSFKRSTGFGTIRLIVWLKDSLARFAVLSRVYASRSMVIDFTAMASPCTYMYTSLATGKRGFNQFLSLPPFQPIVLPAADTIAAMTITGHLEATMTKSKRKQGIPIGELLLQQGVLNARQVEHILAVQKSTHRPFGDLAERLYGIAPKLIEDAWVVQYVHTVGTCDLEELDIDENCLRLLNQRQAWQFHLLPIERDEQSNVSLATDQDHLVRAVNFASRRIDEPVHMMIAEREQLREFLMKHYPVPEFMAEYAAQM